jgi:hypothetical protein
MGRESEVKLFSTWEQAVAKWLFFSSITVPAQVICIEPDKKAFEILRENSRVNGWNVELINEILFSRKNF